MFSAWHSWRWLSWQNMTHEPPIAHCHSEGQTWIHSLYSALMSSGSLSYDCIDLDNTSYLCLEALFPGGVQNNAKFRNLRWEHQFVFKEWSMSGDHCLLSPGNGCWLFFVMCRLASRLDWPQEVCDMWHRVWGQCLGLSGGAGDII